MTSRHLALALALASLLLVTALPASAVCSKVQGVAENPNTGWVRVSCVDGRAGEGYFAGAAHSWIMQEAQQFCCPGEIGNPMFSPEPSGPLDPDGPISGPAGD